MNRRINVPVSLEDRKSLKAGDYVYLTGTIYTARDAAHKRMQDAMDAGEPLPIELEGNVIYYMGPSSALNHLCVSSAKTRFSAIF